jgi:RNA polymerase sigma-70 factor, ECF subfamily
MEGIQEWRRGRREARVGESEERPLAEPDLLRAARTGDRAALEQLLTPHERALYALCRGMLHHADDAEDAVQESFLRALRALPRFRGDAAFRTWLFRIAVNVCLEWKRARPATEVWDEEDAAAVPDTASPEAAVLQNLRVTEALSTLLPRHRAILLLKELEGWSVAEIGAAMGWSVRRVQNELYRARRALADWRRHEAEEGEKP